MAPAAMQIRPAIVLLLSVSMCSNGDDGFPRAGTNHRTLCPGPCLQPGHKGYRQNLKGLSPFCPDRSLQPGQKALKTRDKKLRSFSVIWGRRGQPICPGSRMGRDKWTGRKPSFLLVICAGWRSCLPCCSQGAQM
jgi:hypothetical protein